MRARFEFLWHHFHPSYNEEIIEDHETTLDEEDERIDIRLERVQRDQDNVIENDTGYEEYNNEDTQQVKKKSMV